MRASRLSTLALLLAACGPSVDSQQALPSVAAEKNEQPEAAGIAELLPAGVSIQNATLRVVANQPGAPVAKATPAVAAATPSLEERKKSWTLTKSQESALWQEVHGPLHLEGYLGKPKATDAQIRAFYEGRSALDLFRQATRAQKAIEAKAHGVSVFLMGLPLDRDSTVPVLKEVRVLREMQSEVMASQERLLGMPTPERFWNRHYLNLDRTDTSFAAQRVHQAFTAEQIRLGRNFMI